MSNLSLFPFFITPPSPLNLRGDGGAEGVKLGRLRYCANVKCSKKEEILGKYDKK